VDIFVRTRGGPRELDYQFIGGEAPADFWWRTYKQVTDIERPTILLRSDGTAWQAYIAGIRSRRLDVTDNLIQFNLVLAGECGASADNGLALAVIGRSAADLAGQGGQFIGGDLLDGQLPGDEVERLLRAPGEESAAVAAAAVRAGYRPLAATPPASAIPDGDAASPGGAADAGPLPFRAWLGGIAEPRALATFNTLASGLLHGSRGRAVVLNLISDDVDEAELPAWDGALGVLAARPDANLEMAVRALKKAGSPPRGETSPTKPRQATGTHRKRQRAWRHWSNRTRVALIATVAVTLVAAAIVAGWLVANPPG
jgi:hypothetical protein